MLALSKKLLTVHAFSMWIPFMKGIHMKKSGIMYIRKSRLDSTGQVGCLSDRNFTNIGFVTDWNSWIVLMSSCLLTNINLSTKTDDCRIILEVFFSFFFSFLSSYGNPEELIWKFFWDSSEILLELFWNSSRIILKFF